MFRRADHLTPARRAAPYRDNAQGKEVARACRRIRAPEYSAYGALYRAVADPLQGFLAGLNGRSADTQTIDSTHVKAHRSASGGKGGSRNRLLAARVEGATRRSTHSQMLKGASSPFC